MLVPWYFQPVSIIIPTTKIAHAVAVADCIHSRSFFSSVADDIYHTVVVAKAVTLAPHAHTLVFVKNTCSGRKVFKPINDSPSRRSLYVAGGVQDVLQNKPFCIILANMLVQ